MTQGQVKGSRWVQVWIPLGVGLFILALTLSAIYIPQLRLLHLFQALIYVAVLVLTRRSSSCGFGAGVILASAWNCMNLFITHLFEAGVEELWVLARTGCLERPDTLMVLLGGAAHCVLIMACMAGFLELRPRARHWCQFFAGGTISLAYMALLIATTAPH